MTKTANDTGPAFYSSQGSMMFKFYASTEYCVMDTENLPRGKSCHMVFYRCKFAIADWQLFRPKSSKFYSTLTSFYIDLIEKQFIHKLVLGILNFSSFFVIFSIFDNCEKANVWCQILGKIITGVVLGLCREIRSYSLIVSHMI